MNIFRKLFSKFKKKDKKENEAWYNNQRDNYDHKTGTPNGEAYISPNSAELNVCNYLSNK